MPLKLLLRIDEVMEALCYKSPVPVYQLIRDGKLRAACPNGPGTKPIRVTRISVEKYIKSITVAPEDWTDLDLAKKPLRRKVISRGIKRD
jgi:hypothetical protein